MFNEILNKIFEKNLDKIEENIHEEYYKRIKGEKIEEPLFSKWDNPFTVDDYIKNGAKEWEAYLMLYNEYTKRRF